MHNTKLACGRDISNQHTKCSPGIFGGSVKLKQDNLCSEVLILVFRDKSWYRKRHNLKSH